ncbi:ATP-binding cassette domain-containing protein [Legionella maioricensis]|uniref:ATP-binding cassette domain-containing protein n=1 Tax=Legionella maioricensis TaxID=2896528 RepID=A0A9X2CYU2_9GAMM|nr:ATP-binding cassette domain-containing protein [Legionella maioricensis]MCL9682797.1 ATP-binding cassette domain-containing protein [Legionella maioricensis]MCL9686575.1 ATP-binding cassette domain-containing protein [Legionella maioricensis]
MNCFIQLIDISLYFTPKTCFEAFNYEIQAGERIALIGNNGSGKSSMLKIIKKLISPSDGFIKYAKDLTIAYVPQLPDCAVSSSGAEQFNHALTAALAQNPHVLLLDEPTNHLDSKNRQSLMRLLDQFSGTLIIASHDVSLLRRQKYCFWHFNQKQITTFHGNFDHYQQQRMLQRQAVEEQIEHLQQQKKQNHLSLMKEQVRAKNSRIKGEKSIQQSKWPTIVSKSKMLRALETSGKKKKNLSEDKRVLSNRLQELDREEEIIPQFELTLSSSTTKALVTITEGAIAYDQHVVLNHINLNVTGQSRLALCGANGSGKSTLLKAIMGDSSVHKDGLWITPSPTDIGYLDQHYQLLNKEDTVLETIAQCRPDWVHNTIRHHLNNFLFRKNEQVNSTVAMLSGGEKARLSLAKIAAKPPKLLLLDELTNNLDLKTRNHVVTLLKSYPGPFIIISHDRDFLDLIHINETYLL